VRPGDDRDDVMAVTASREFILWLRRHELDARQFAAGELLETHNDAWNEDEPISAQTFAERMTLEGVGVDRDGCGSLYYEDGDLFWGHCIVVSVDRNREFRSADIAG
jgi:hypothetical protein